jgi:type VI secretion system secreted protein Hcp
MASDFYLKIGDIEGDSTADGHEKEIEVTSMSLGFMMPVGPRSSAGSATTEKVQVTEVTLSKVMDASSTKLMLACCLGTHYDSAIVSINRPDGQGGQVEYAKWELNDVIVSSFQNSGGGTGLPMESLSLNYGKITLNYTQTDPATGAAQGSLASGWDVGTNKQV